MSWNCIEVQWSGAYEGKSNVYTRTTGYVTELKMNSLNFNITKENQILSCKADTIRSPPYTKLYAVVRYNGLQLGCLVVNTNGSLEIWSSWTETNFALGSTTLDSLETSWLS